MNSWSRLTLPGRGLLLAAIGLTGATALAYEVAWTRGLVLVLGSTSTTTAVVLAVFVGALGLGARWGGPRADASERPLRLYGLLELGAAVWAVLALGLAGWLLGPYAAVAGPLPSALRLVLRIAVAAVVVAPGAFLLGATLPALVRFWVRETDGAGRGTAWVYGANTLGAVGGTLAAGFWGIEALGVTGWLALAAGVAALVGVIATALGSKLRVPISVAAEAAAESPPVLALRPALVAAALCGGIGLAIEVTGFRILVFFVEGFTATFSAMLAVFILGLGLGSLLLGPWLTRTDRPDRRLGQLLPPVAALLLLGMTWVLPNLEGWLAGLRTWIYAGVAGEASVQAALRWTALAGSAALLLVPAVLLGATFPLCVRWAECAGLPPGQAVGRVYLANSLGTVLAPFVFAFVVIPLGGLARAWDVVLVVTLWTGVWLLARRLQSRLSLGFALLPLLVLGFLLLVQDDSSRQIVQASHVLRGHPERRLVDVRTDSVTTASVVEAPGAQKILYTDDFAAAATGRHYRYMRMLGHLPVLLAKDPANAMVIAFGTGTTAGAVAAHEDVKRLEVVEVSRAVFDLAGHFEEANRNVLEDERTQRVRDDGRNALLLHEPDLDVITLEPLMPYSPAGLPFYTKEFYELAMSRLRDGGVLCQWVPVHAMPAGLYAAFVRTFFEACPQGSLWFFEQSSALIAVKGEGADREAFVRRAEAVQADLAAAGFTTPDLVLSGYVASGAKVLASPMPPSPWEGRSVRDLDPYPEFHPTPRAPLSTSYLQDTIGYLWTLTSPDDLPPYVEAGSREAARLREGTARALLARGAEAMAVRARVARDGETAARLMATALQEYGRALMALPGESVLLWRRARIGRLLSTLEVATLLAEVRTARAEDRTSEAEDALQRALAVARRAVLASDGGEPVAGERWRAVLLEAAVLRQMGRCQAMVAVLAAGREAMPPGSVERAFLTSVAKGEGVPPEFRPFFADAPPCGKEGIALLERPLELWREARKGDDLRALRLAADNLYVAARLERLLGAVAETVRKGGTPEGVNARAVWAGLLARLDPDASELEALLLASEAVHEAARLRMLRRYPALAESLATQTSPAARIAFAEAASQDGDQALLRRTIELLLDDDRTVRYAAAAALLRHYPTEIEKYDPDAPKAAREKVVDTLR